MEKAISREKKASGGKLEKKIRNFGAGRDYAAVKWEFEKRFEVIRRLNQIYDLRTNTVISARTLRDIAAADWFFIDKNGERKNFAYAWLADADRACRADLTFAPGDAPVTSDNRRNTWRGWGVASYDDEPIEAKPGDVWPLQLLLDFLFFAREENGRVVWVPGNQDDRDARRWLEQRFAWMRQHPDDRAYSAIVLWSSETGVGKSLLGYVIAAAIGDYHSIEIENSELSSNFNEELEAKIFVVASEIAQTGRFNYSDKLKNLITRPEMVINGKHRPKYRYPNRMTLMVTSNQPNAAYIEDQDRRLWVYETQAPKLSLLGPTVGKYIYDWAHSRAGRAAICAHLDNVAMSGFDPYGPAPRTKAWREMRNATLNEPTRYLMRISEEKILGDSDILDLETIVRGARDRIENPAARTETVIYLAMRQLPEHFASLGRMWVDRKKKIRRSLWAVRKPKFWKSQLNPVIAAEWVKHQHDPWKFGRPGARSSR